MNGYEPIALHAAPLHFVLLELAMLACTVIVLAHAIAAWKRGDRRPMFQWILLTSYGVQMELIAFALLQNYEHGTFTVQLHDGQLPLYVTGLYGTFMYTGIEVARRLRAHPVVECVLAGFAMCLIDLPFDLAGVTVGWWRWLDGDPNLAFRWLGVPVTSYEWYLIFGAVACALVRVLWARVEARAFSVAAVTALCAGTLVIVLGVLGFLPFHLLAALGLSHGAIVALHLAIGAGLAIRELVIGGERAVPIDRAIAAVAVLLPAGHVVLLVAMTARGEVEDSAARIVLSIAAASGLAAMSWWAPARRVVPAIAEVR